MTNLLTGWRRCSTITEKPKERSWRQNLASKSSTETGTNPAHPAGCSRGILCGDRRSSPGGYCQEEGWCSHRLQLSPTLRSGEVIDSDLCLVPPASSVCRCPDGGFSYVQKGPGDHGCTRPL